MSEVGVLEAKTRFSSLLKEVEEGGEVVITRHGRPVARVVPFADGVAPSRRLSGPELVARMKALHARLSAAGEDRDPVTWEELKETARS